MISLGLQIDHDPSACLMRDGEILWFGEEKKLIQYKNYNGVPWKCLDEIRQYCYLYEYSISQVMVTGYNYNPEILSMLDGYFKYVKLPVNKTSWAPFSPHHNTHLIKAFKDSGFESARVFVIDGRGSDWYLEDNTEAYETCSIYDVTSSGVKCIYKKLFSKNNKNLKVNTDYLPYQNKYNIKPGPLFIDKDTVYEVSSNLDLGHFYYEVSKHFGYEEEEGKFMGYQSYGSVNNDLYNELQKGVTAKTIESIVQNKDNAATCQKFFEDSYAELVQKYKASHMVFTGGTALNVVNNYKIQKKFWDCDVYHDPLCADAGNSIGVNYFFQSKAKPLKNLFIGDTITVDERLHEGEKIKFVESDQVNKLLLQGEVVGIINGRAEAGPRALGNRSLLLDPRLPNAKDKMNEIKQRESFRPFACSILQNFADDYFQMLSNSPNMMYAVDAKDLAKEYIPSVVHVDNTCRVQTVTKEYNPFLYNILNYHTIPALMNTSFNLAGLPIVHSYGDVLWTLRNSPLKYVYFPETRQMLISK